MWWGRHTVLEVQRKIDSYKFEYKDTYPPTGHQINFDVNMSNTNDVDDSTIELFNYNQTIGKDTYVRLKSGYMIPENSLVTIFVGEVIEMQKDIRDGSFVQKLRCADASSLLLKQKQKFVFKKGLEWETAIQYMIQETAGISAIGKISPTDKTFSKKKEFAYDTPVWDHISELAEEIGFKFYARAGKIYFVNPGYYVPNAYKIDYDSGLRRAYTRYEKDDPEDIAGVGYTYMATIFLPRVIPDGLIVANTNPVPMSSKFNLYVITSVNMKADSNNYECLLKCRQKVLDVEV